MDDFVKFQVHQKTDDKTVFNFGRLFAFAACLFRVPLIMFLYCPLKSKLFYSALPNMNSLQFAYLQKYFYIDMSWDNFIQLCTLNLLNIYSIKTLCQ